MSDGIRTRPTLSLPAVVDTASLIKYEALCRAVSEAKNTDEVKNIRDKMLQIQAYARQARNRDLEADAAEIRLRATRKLGEIMATQSATVGLADGGDAARVARGIQNPEVKPTLEAAGIDKNLAKEARKARELKPIEFDKLVTVTRGNILRRDVFKEPTQPRTSGGPCIRSNCVGARAFLKAVKAHIDDSDWVKLSKHWPGVDKFVDGG